MRALSFSLVYTFHSRNPSEANVTADLPVMVFIHGGSFIAGSNVFYDHQGGMPQLETLELIHGCSKRYFLGCVSSPMRPEEAGRLFQKRKFE